MKTRQSNQARVLGAVTAVALMFGGIGSASAYVAGSIPTGAQPNDGVVPVYGATPRSGYFGANVWLVGGPATLTIEYFGSEAGFDNSFAFGGSTLFNTGGGTSPSGNFTGSALASTSVASVASGLLDFSFTSPLGTVTNGSNPDNTTDGVVNFFATFYDPNDGTATSGTVLDLWLDDAGANDDDDHDDMMIRLSVEGGSLTTVPIPAAVWLFGSALLGMVGIGTRRARKV